MNSWQIIRDYPLTGTRLATGKAGVQPGIITIFDLSGWIHSSARREN